MPNRRVRWIATVIAGALLFSIGNPLLFAGGLFPMRRPIKIKFQEFRLANGLRVIIAEDHSAPVISLTVTYNVGSHDEEPGQTGYAHLFEHMMFKESENVAEGEFDYLVETNGGELNANTDQDRTQYFETLPNHQLEMALFLEADRMRSLVLTQDGLDNQREAVKEELRGDLGEPYGNTGPTVFATAFDNFAYAHPVIGSMEDLNVAKLKDISAFFSNYYAPNNAVLVLVGDVKTNDALPKIERYFGNIPSHEIPPDPDLSEPRQTQERRKTITDPVAKMARLDVVYKLPNEKSQKAPAVGVLINILTHGKSSRLYRSLVEDQKVALDFGGFVYSTQGPSLAYFVLIVAPDVTPEQAEAALDGQIELVKTEKVEHWELQKVRQQLRRELAENMLDTASRAQVLGEYAVNQNNPGLINQQEKEARSVNARDIQIAAQRYLQSSNRTVVITLPNTEEPAQQ